MGWLVHLIVIPLLYAPLGNVGMIISRPAAVAGPSPSEPPFFCLSRFWQAGAPPPCVKPCRLPTRHDLPFRDAMWGPTPSFHCLANVGVVVPRRLIRKSDTTRRWSAEGSYESFLVGGRWNYGRARAVLPAQSAMLPVHVLLTRKCPFGPARRKCCVAGSGFVVVVVCMLAAPPLTGVERPGCTAPACCRTTQRLA
jgi:hypothetical protein